MPKTIPELEEQYIAGEWSYIDAIQYLQDHFSYSPREAETLVESWED